MKTEFKAALAIVGISALSLAGIRADHESGSGRSGIHSSGTKPTRTHSSSAHPSKKEKVSRENKAHSKARRRGATGREHTPDTTQIQEQNLIPAPPVDLPRHEDGNEDNVQRDEDSSANLMSTQSETDDNGGDQL